MQSHHIKARFAIVLNPVTARCEDVRIAAFGDSREALLAMLEADRIPGGKRETDANGYHQSFIEGSPLRGFNPPYAALEDDGHNTVNRHGAGVYDLCHAPWWHQDRIGLSDDTMFILRKRFAA